ncbi:MAG: hypothetical protein K8M05_01455 [Deltaproteobacteria bacterium]|nr:hypothetical protein [Kofleriaceae bacterium]
MSDAAPSPAQPAGAPPAFTIAVAVMLGVGTALSLVVAYAATRAGRPVDGSWVQGLLFQGRSLVATATSFAVTVLMLVGFAELVRRSGPGRDGLVLRAGLVALVVMLLSALAAAYMLHWWWPRGESSRERAETMDAFVRWRGRLVFAAALVASASLIAAGRRHRVVVVAAAPLLVFTALQHPIPWLHELVSFEDPSHGELWLQAAIDIWIRIGFCGALVATVSAIGAALPPAPADMVRAGQGLERVGSGLVARVIVILVSIFTLIMTVGAQSPGMQRVAGVLFPACLLVASIAIVTGMLQVGGLSAAGAPRKRLYAGAALTMSAMVIDAIKAVSLYLALRRGGEDDAYVVERLKRVATALPYLSPVLALAGLWCVLSAAVVLRRMTPDARVDERGIRAAAASVTIFTAAAVALLRWVESGVKSPATFVIVSIVVAFANIVAQLAVARVCHRVGGAMREVAVLPSAVATVK